MWRIWSFSEPALKRREILGEVEARTGELARLFDSAERAVQGVLGGGVRIDNHGVIEMPRDIAELAVLKHDLSVTSRLTRSRWFGWFPSTLVVTGNYSGKLGIDLGKMRGVLDVEARTLELDLPPAKVLSVETTGLWRSFEAQSWFTPFAPYEVIELVRRNRAEARGRLDQLELLQAADERLRERLHAALAGTGVQLKTAEPAGSVGRKSTCAAAGACFWVPGGDWCRACACGVCQSIGRVAPLKDDTGEVGSLRHDS